jgi:hypothetical protein
MADDSNNYLNLGGNGQMNGEKRCMPKGIKMSLLIIVGAMAVLQGCQSQKLDFKTDYQSVILDNGLVYFGKLKEVGTSYLLLNDVYYVQSNTTPGANQVTNTLIKRGKEWHGPEFMYINTQHVLLIEPISPDSLVAKLIKEDKAKSPGETK